MARLMARLPLQASVALQEQLRKISLPRSFEKSALLFRQGDRAKGIYLIEKGTVGLMLKLHRDGVTVCQRTVGKGSVLGVPGVMSGTAYSLSAKALSVTEVAFVPRERLIEAMNHNSSLGIEILKVLSHEILDMRELIRTKCRGRARLRNSAIA